MNGLLVVGAGGHGKVVADTACQTGQWDKIAFLDDRYPKLNTVEEWPVLGNLEQAGDFIKDYPNLIVAIGNNTTRINLLKQFESKRFKIPYIIHPLAYVSRIAKIKPGTVIFAHSVVNIGSKVGFGCIVNTGATVDHDCRLGEGVHLSPGVHLGGEVSIGNFSWLGISSTVINQIFIGRNVIIGAGTVVINNIEDNVTVVGVPGKVIKKGDS